MRLMLSRTMIGAVVGKTYWCLRSPWMRAYFHERNGGCKVYQLGFGWRVTSQPVNDR